jgi:hypothetical protein
VIESTGYEVEISDRSWIMTEEQEREQGQRSFQAMEQFMNSLARNRGRDLNPERPGSVGTDGEDAEANRALKTISEIEKLKAKARDLSGGQMMEGSGEDLVRLEVQRQFWQNVVSFESAPRRVQQELLAENGFHALPEAALSDAELTAELWRLIKALAGRRVYLQGTL